MTFVAIAPGRIASELENSWVPTTSTGSVHFNKTNSLSKPTRNLTWDSVSARLEKQLIKPSVNLAGRTYSTIRFNVVLGQRGTATLDDPSGSSTGAFSSNQLIKLA